eukprot:CAMPEP_0194381166 /NCGR_PEP_ID=MMETSP0174-20130528/50934_1 /TAXON_ID=216777 /ORGANISM="Proboscia alata, Strain PI-D3" /LENGTH=78 /DNA_ID=CAMNT_0039165251 /DNA_START=74 /DNA_END=310 /DNA_ORIENTATION=-
MDINSILSGERVGDEEDHAVHKHAAPVGEHEHVRPRAATLTSITAATMARVEASTEIEGVQQQSKQEEAEVRGGEMGG